jgi:hypothetical protein
VRIFSFCSPIIDACFLGLTLQSGSFYVQGLLGKHPRASRSPVPAQPIAARCPICGEHRRYLPSEVFLGRLSYLLMDWAGDGQSCLRGTAASTVRKTSLIAWTVQGFSITASNPYWEKWDMTGASE